MTVVLILLALTLDRALGEPPRFHPLVGFGRVAAWLERFLRARPSGCAPDSRARARLAGIAAVAVLLLIPAALLMLLQRALTDSAVLLPALDVLVLYFVIGARSLGQHAERAWAALTSGAIDEARTATACLVSRDVAPLDETGLCKAVVESVLENGNDAIFAPLFWFCLVGAPGAVVYRLANTLDAMWGYKTERYHDFGWAPARLDDLLNWLPARLTALAYALCGDCREALCCWRAQAPAWASPNAGPVMASGAGALGCELGGAASYHGRIERRPVLGCGAAPTPADIGRALRLVDRATLIWITAIAICALAAGDLF